MSHFEPRRVAPDTPPQTPPTNKDGGLARHPRPAGIFTELNNAPPLTPDASPHPGFSTSPTLLSPQDLPGAGSDMIGLGLGFGGEAFLQSKFCTDSDEKTRKPKPISQFSKPKSRGYIVNPYNREQQPMTTTLSHLLRVPRRMRPALLLATSLFVFGVILISRSVSAASQAERMSQMIRQAQSRATAPFGRLYVAREGLAPVDINEQRQGQIPQVPIGHDSRVSHRTMAAKHASTIKFTAEDELLALIGFITAATGNSIPPTVDASQPIEPAVLVGFDPAGASAKEDLEFLKDEINTQYPLVLFGRMRDPWHVEMVHLLDQYKITPAPLIVDVDQRNDHDLVVTALERLLGTDELPQLVLQGSRLSSAQQLVALTEEELKATLTATHALTMRPLTSKEKKGHGHGKNGKFKAERERLLAPAPIVVE